MKEGIPLVLAQDSTVLKISLEVMTLLANHSQGNRGVNECLNIGKKRSAGRVNVI
jgi:hypothetical protein